MKPSVRLAAKPSGASEIRSSSLLDPDIFPVSIFVFFHVDVLLVLLGVLDGGVIIDTDYWGGIDRATKGYHVPPHLKFGLECCPGFCGSRLTYKAHSIATNI